MSFDKAAEARESHPKIALEFKNGHPTPPTNLPMPPHAYLFVGWHGTDDQERVMLTHRSTSFEELKAQVDDMKAQLDSRLAEAKAQFLAMSN